MKKSWTILRPFYPSDEIELWGPTDNISKNQGQAFIEFVFLMAITISLAYIFFNLSNRAVSLRWMEMVNLIVAPSKVTLP